jgi:D-alanine-D-alanine ligase
MPGEIISRHEFYSYDAKYVDDRGADLVIPAKLEKDTARKIQDLAVKTFRLTCCEGLARVDFFIRENGDILVNEINTMPGFTAISMFPKLWEASGIPPHQLIDRLVELAFERHDRE